MRFFRTYKEALNEITRDLAELSVEVKTVTYQDKVIENDPDFYTKECQNYAYTVTSPNLADLNPTQPWADEEFQERVNPGIASINPGVAWTFRPEVWDEFLEADGRFSYSYHDRIVIPLRDVTAELKLRPTSRQLWIPVWDANDCYNLGNRRVPCSLGYQLQYRQNTLNMTYIQRSADFFTHFENDVYLARRLQEYIAQQVGMTPGLFSHMIFSLHVFSKDVAKVF